MHLQRFFQHAQGDIPLDHDRAAGAETHQILDLGIGVGARDDTKAGIGSPCLRDDLSGVESAGHRNHQELRPLEVRRRQHIRVGAVADQDFDPLIARRLHRFQRLAASFEIRFDTAAKFGVSPALFLPLGIELQPLIV